MKRKLSLQLLLILIPVICRAQNQFPAALPDSISPGEQGEFHVQGIAVDKANGFIYFSFTNKLIKTDLSGNLIGSIKGLKGHLGDLAFDPETNIVYGSLEYKNDDIGKGINDKLGLKNMNYVSFYIAMINGSEIIKPDMDAGEEDILKTVYLKDVEADYNAEVKLGTRLVPHRFGCSGIDGVALGPSIGQKKNQKKYLYVAYGIYGDTLRSDNDYQVILKYNIDKWSSLGQKLTQDNPHRSGPEKPSAKYFIKTGNTTYGIQNLAFDNATGNFFAAVYKGTKRQFPNYSLFVIDGHKKPARSTINTNNKKIKVQTLSLVKAGLLHESTGIRGWEFKWGSTGLFPLGNGHFYISHNRKTNDGKETTTLYKYKWIGSNSEAFIPAK